MRVELSHIPTVTPRINLQTNKPFHTQRVDTDSLYLHTRQEPLLPSYQTVMTKLSVTVTKKNTLTLINPPLRPLCSPNPISNKLCLWFFRVLTNGLSNLQRMSRERQTESEREGRGAHRKQNDVRIRYWWIPEGGEQTQAAERWGKRDIRRGRQGWGWGAKLTLLCKAGWL